MPECVPTSEQLHMVVQLSAGIGDTISEEINEYKEIDSRAPSPSRKPKQPSTERLKEALKSNISFQKLYLVRI